MPATKRNARDAAIDDSTSEPVAKKGVTVTAVHLVKLTNLQRRLPNALPQSFRNSLENTSPIRTPTKAFVTNRSKPGAARFIRILRCLLQSWRWIQEMLATSLYANSTHLSTSPEAVSTTPHPISSAMPKIATPQSRAPLLPPPIRSGGFDISLQHGQRVVHGLTGSLRMKNFAIY